jgi:hypothetical protein
MTGRCRESGADVARPYLSTTRLLSSARPSDTRGTSPELALRCAQGIQATCLVAVIDNVPGSALAEAVTADLDASCQLPAADVGAPPQLVVGTLDINIGKQRLSCFLP